MVKNSGTPNSEKKHGGGGPVAVVEVCQGPDCFGAGGGAAILELEDLACFAAVTVVAGGCRNFCSMGPNVHYHPHRHHQGQQPQQQQHFTKVQSVRDCHDVMDHVRVQHAEVSTTSSSSAFNNNNAPSSMSSGGGGMTNIMMQRAEKKRWTFLRKVARAKAAHQKNKPQFLRPRTRMVADLLQELEGVVAAETSAARGDASALERAARRNDHLETTITSLLIQENT